MTITQGDNFSGAADDVAWLVSTREGSQFKVLNSHENQVLLHSPKTGTLLLVTIKVPLSDFSAALKENKTIAKSGFDSAIAYMAVSHDALILGVREETSAVWVHKNYRGKGYGKALYKVAYEMSKKGIRSSDSLGTMSLGLWISLFKAHPEIKLNVPKWYQGALDRKKITVNGLDILYDYGDKLVELTARGTPTFYFIWPK